MGIVAGKRGTVRTLNIDCVLIDVGMFDNDKCGDGCSFLKKPGDESWERHWSCCLFDENVSHTDDGGYESYQYRCSSCKRAESKS